MALCDTASPGIIVGWTTTADKETALRLARTVVEAGAAACAQISGPVLSIYRWEGKRCEEEELRITFKLAAAAEPRLRTLLSQHHPYAVPQWVAVPASHALPEYAAWVAQAEPI